MILEKINTSRDIKNLSSAELVQLADEIRSFLIKNISKTGGHLAANLGVVELTLAIHRIFNVDYDRIVWDVGHQSYTHKILTGRKDLFSTLRQLGGMSGFPKTEESCSDAFNTGHSSTSISAAAGFAVAAKLKNENRMAVAVIGDGALTGGMAFEALNHAGAMNIPLIVILNDNGMSISKNVGGLSRKLKKIRNTRRYYDFKSNLKSTLDRIPAIGSPLKKRVIKLKKALKPLVVENVFFEDFGFTYLGPVDGHNLGDLEVVLNHAKSMQEPVIVHVHTKKGKGYPPAEKDPGLFHGVSEFDFKTGQPVEYKKSCDWSKYFGKMLCNFAIEIPEIVAITAAMPSGTGLEEFKRKFPDRFFDVGIAEQHAVTFAAGMAKSGFTPCVAVYSTFLQRAYDQILHDVALQNLHVVFCVDHTGPVGRDGETHQGVFDISFLSHMPGFTILSPSNSKDFEKMLYYALHRCNGPVAIRYPKGEISVPYWEISKTSPMSRLLKDGSDILIAAVGTTVFDALKVSEILEKSGISTAVLDVGVIKPIDKEAILKYSEGKKAVVSVEDNVITGGFGEQLSAMLKRDIQIFAYPDEAIMQGSVNELKIRYGLSAEQIAKTLLKTIVI